MTTSPPPEPRVLITGASGFIGSAIVREALHRGLWVRAAGHRHGAEPASQSCEVDVLDNASLARAVDGVEVVIHAAGLAHIVSPSASAGAEMMAVNATGTANLVRAASESGVTHFVLVSSVSVYGGYQGGQCDEKTPCRPADVYALSKREGEVQATGIARAGGMRLTILRMATVYGEGDRGNIARLMRAIDRRRFVWVGSGSNRKTLIYRGDAARACVAALALPSNAPVVFNVATTVCSMAEIVEALAAALGRPVPRLRLPETLARRLTATAAALPFAPRKVRTLHLTMKKWLAEDVFAFREFEVAARFRHSIPLIEGMTRQVASYRAKAAQPSATPRHGTVPSTTEQSFRG